MAGAAPPSWVAWARAALGASAAAAFSLAARRLGRTFAARRRIRLLLAEAAGTEARVVITGATSGIGAELAWQLVRHPSVSLLLGCRDVKRAKYLFRQLGAAIEGEEIGEGCRCRIVQLELQDPDSVQCFTEEVHAFLGGGAAGLRLLVHNAGVMNPPASKRSAARPDAAWHAHFLGPFLLTELLARLRAKGRAQSAPVRLVNVTSRLEARSQLTEKVLEEVSQGQCGSMAYADSKRAALFWISVRAQSLAFKSGLFLHAATPGIVDTQLGRHSMQPWLWPWTKPLRWLFLRSAAEGAYCVAAAGLRKQALECFGRYLDGEVQLEDLVMERMGEKQFANKIVKWAIRTSALEQRAEGYDK